MTRQGRKGHEIAEQNGEFGWAFRSVCGEGKGGSPELFGAVVDWQGDGGDWRWWCLSEVVRREKERKRQGRREERREQGKGATVEVVVFGGSGWPGDAGWLSGGENGGGQWWMRWWQTVVDGGWLD
ncbi:hypothetical protein SOVF_023810 [Spinacia oleracea]|nr:hypothetical protein SOVF_023810 [Spinacia oleracea]